MPLRGIGTFRRRPGRLGHCALAALLTLGLSALTGAAEQAPTPQQQSVETFWAFRPVLDTPPPAVRDTAWPKSPLDPFILAGLEAKGLSPAPPAEKHVLVRRAYLDLTGLPPTPAEVRAFVEDASPDAWEKLIDRLLASPRYGEKWGRHWLDLARYADTNGMDENMVYSPAWRYRDYVIGSFNADKPYDQFVREQIAGDLMPAREGEDPQAMLGRLTATGFLVIGPKMLAEDDPVKMEMDIVDEQVDTVGRAFLGMTLGCARCHDHMFDPVSMADYYAMAGIFKSTRSMENFTVVAKWSERPLATAEQVAHAEQVNQQVAAKNGEVAQLVAAENEKLLSEARGKSGQYLLAAGQIRSQQALAEAAATAPRPGTFLLEAEASPRNNLRADSDHFGVGVGIVLDAGAFPNFAEYDLDVPQQPAAAEGAYALVIRYAAAEERPVEVLLDGQNVIASAAGGVTGSWHADGQRWASAGLLELAPGRHVLRLERSQAFPHIDKLALIPAASADEAAAWRDADRLTDNGELNPAILQQWSGYLGRVKDDRTSVFTPWLDWHADPRGVAQALSAADPAASPLAAQLLVAPRPTNSKELADRFGQLLNAADAAWRALKSTPEGAAAEQLPDLLQEALRRPLYDEVGPFALPASPERFYPPDAAATLAKLREELAALEKDRPNLPRVMAVADGNVQNLNIHLRGSHLTLGDEVPRGFPASLGPAPRPMIDPSQSGRLQLADWIASPANPLTARVMVNRIWQHHFGHGLVRSPDNFGTLGEKPDNPQLLDWLAARFVESGWSVKSMHRLIMRSAAYRMSTRYDAAAAAADPENRLLWRMNRRRMTAEELRDGLLAVAGQLDPAPPPGGSLIQQNSHEYFDRGKAMPAIESARVRSVYLPVIRSGVDPMFMAFDFADPSTLNGQRATTTVAPQALFLMNGKLMDSATRGLAELLVRTEGVDDAGRVRDLYERAYARPATDQEAARALQFVARYDQSLEGLGLDPAERRVRAWQGLCRVVLSSSEFVYVE